jgi:diguanylate cyclase (GGDEF)-like protein
MGVVAVLFLVLSLFATGWSVQCIRRSRNVPGRTAFGFALIGTLWWASTTIAQIVSPGVDGKILASEIAWLGNTSAPLYWGLSIDAYVFGRARESRAALAAVALSAGGAMTAALTNDFHHAIYASFDVVDASYGVKVVYHHGWLFWAIIGAVYAALSSAVLVSLWAARKAPRIHRRQFFGLLAAVATPWAFNVLTLSVGFTIYGVDPEPFGFLATGAILAFVFGRDRLFAVAPIASDILFEAIPDPVIAIDGAGWVLELNSAARDLPGMAAEPVGAPIAGPAELVETLPLRPTSNAVDRFEIAVAANGRSYEVFHRALASSGDGGRLRVLRDVTESHAVREELIAKSDELQRRLKQNVALQRRLRYEAEHDHLTGLYNRGAAHAVLPSRLAAARAGARGAALALLDLDHFKQVNDRYGHQVGDEVLRAFAAALRHEAATGECAFRHGGEEFLVFLPDATADDVLARCAAWRAHLREMRIPSAPEATIAFSVGVAVMPEAGVEMAQLVRAADVALYQAKAAGRDRVVVWGRDPLGAPLGAAAPIRPPAPHGRAVA